MNVVAPSKQNGPSPAIGAAMQMGFVPKKILVALAERIFGVA
jgi:hypothetical protein